MDIIIEIPTIMELIVELEPELSEDFALTEAAAEVVDESVAELELAFFAESDLVEDTVVAFASSEVDAFFELLVFLSDVVEALAEESVFEAVDFESDELESEDEVDEAELEDSVLNEDESSPPSMSTSSILPLIVPSLASIDVQSPD